MTKEQFLKTYGQPNTVVSFKNDAEKMEFLKECEKFDIKWTAGEKATKYPARKFVFFREFGLKTTETIDTEKEIHYTSSPKSLIKDGWMGVTREDRKVYFIKSLNVYVKDNKLVLEIDKFYGDMLLFDTCNLSDIMELYDNLGNLQWKREEKSAKDIEIERIQAEMNKLADDLSKLKGE